MSTTSLTSELEAINTMLDAAGESPVNSLDASGLVDVAKAKATLDEVSRSVQEKGWHFNSESCYPLPRSYGDVITLPVNCLKVDAIRSDTSVEVTQRGNRLYDKKAHTFKFTKDLQGDIVFLLPWDELPQAARTYIMIRAARIFQTRTLGSDTLHRFSQEQETDALIALKDAEGETGDYNMLTGSYSVATILER